MRFRTILSHINLLNILLIGIVATFSSYVIPSFYDLKVNFTMPAPKAGPEDQQVKQADNQIPSIAEYAIIAEQNLFHSERKIPAAKKEEQQLPKPEFVLYGTLITGETKVAYLEDLKAPHNTAGRGKRQRTLRLGATISGYILKEIYHDKVIMAKGDEGIVVRVAENKRVKTIETAPPAATPTPASPPGSISEKPKR